jgi:hypothetical protein
MLQGRALLRLAVCFPADLPRPPPPMRASSAIKSSGRSNIGYPMTRLSPLVRVSAFHAACSPKTLADSVR